MIYVDEKYTDASKFQFPDRYTDPKEKKKEYCLKNAQAIYSTHVRNKSGIPIDIIPEWQNLRLYGKGLQDENQYIRTLTGGNESNNSSVLDVVSTDSTTYNTKLERRKAWDNVNKQIISLAPKIKDHFYGMFKKQEYDVTANTIDEDSGALMEDMKFRLLAQSMFAKELALLRRTGNLPEPRQDFLPQDMTELELFESAGGFKLNYAMDMEKLLKHTFHISDWDNNIKQKLIDDATDIGVVATIEDYDEDIGKSKIRYVDVCNLAIQYSTAYDFEDSEWFGYMEYWPVSKLRQKGFSKDFLMEQIENYGGKFGNPDTVGYEEDLGFNRHNYDAFKIPVFITYWIDMDAEYQEVFMDSQGRKRVKPLKFGKKVDTEKKETRIKKERPLYTSKWIVGTDEVFDEGKAYNQTFKDEKAILPVRVVKLTDNSIIKRLKPIFDDMQMAWLKYQNAQIMAMNAGYAINVRLLNNISLGGKKLSMKDVFDIMRETGNLFYSDTPIFGKYEGGAVNPVTHLPGGMGNQLQEAVTKFEWAIKMIEHETGLTPISMGATPSPEQGKATTELSMAATQNVIRPIIDNIMVLKGRIAENSMLRIQLLIRTNERTRKAYTRIIGKKGIEALRAAEGRAVAYGIDLEPRPTDEQKAWVMQLVNEAIALGRDGVQSLEISDALALINQLENGGNLKEIGIRLAYKIKQYKLEQQQKALQSIQVTSQETQKQNAQKAQLESQRKQQDAQIELGNMKQEHNQNLQIETFKANADYKELLTELAFKERELESKERIAKQQKTTSV
jgi:hypothetical protein